MTLPETQTSILPIIRDQLQRAPGLFVREFLREPNGEKIPEDQIPTERVDFFVAPSTGSMEFSAEPLNSFKRGLKEAIKNLRVPIISPKFDRAFKDGGQFIGDLTLGLLCFEESTGGYTLGIVNYHIWVRPYPNAFLANLMYLYESGLYVDKTRINPLLEPLVLRDHQEPTVTADQIRTMLIGQNPFYINPSPED